ncbi:response regulator transcription factor [Candidatus Berkelbacteria bacterium]|nr:response regulator transcription factor [Candidatus Berkelbacteria bacterium]
MRILFIDDEKDLLETLVEELKRKYKIDATSTGKDGLYKAQVNSYDLVVLDLGLPDMDGIEVLKEIRVDGATTPILILTGQSEIEKKVALLDAGADDYLTKPFSLDELKARIRALLRREFEAKTNVLEVADLKLDSERRLVWRNSQQIKLRRLEFDLLEFLMKNQGKVVSRAKILEHVWGSDVDPMNNSIDVHIKHLRDKIDRDFDTKLIETLHGEGYKLDEQS